MDVTTDDNEVGRAHLTPSDIEVKLDEIHKILQDMRELGVEKQIELPQLIVIGDQSSAKSSVLEAFSGVRLPTNDVLCTRFPIELCLEKKDISSFNISIQPFSQATPAEKTRLKAWDVRKHLINPQLKDLAKIVDLAANEMGIRADEEDSTAAETGSDMIAYSEDAETESDDLDAGRPRLRQHVARETFSRHALRIEIYGPQMPTLALVDLPGLFHSKGGRQTLEDAQNVRELAVEYMSRPRAIILAVVQATVDPATQIVTTLAAQCDKEQRRTFGVITKPDTLAEAPNLFKTYVKVLENKYTPLSLGFHTVRTRKPSERQIDSKDFLKIEQALFTSPPWKDLPQELMGVPNLKIRLDRIIYNHVTRLALPLSKEVDDLIQQHNRRLQELETLSSSVITSSQLRQIGDNLHNLLQMAINGDYQHDVFRRGKTPMYASAVYLRISVERLVTNFTNEIRTLGHKYSIVDGDQKQDYISLSPSVKQDKPIKMSPNQYLALVIDRLQNKHTVPGQLDYDIFWDLYREQAQQWLTILEHLVNDITIDVVQCVETLARELCEGSPELESYLLHAVVKPTLDLQFAQLRQKVVDDTQDIRQRTALRSLAASVTNEIAVSRRQQWKLALKQDLLQSIEPLNSYTARH